MPRRRRFCPASGPTLEASWRRSGGSGDDCMTVTRRWGGRRNKWAVWFPGWDQEGKATHGQRDQEEDSSREATAPHCGKPEGGRPEVGPPLFISDSESSQSHASLTHDPLDPWRIHFFSICFTFKDCVDSVHNEVPKLLSSCCTLQSCLQGPVCNI